MAVIADLLVRVGSDIGSFRQGMTQVKTDVAEAESGLGKLGIAAGIGIGALVAGGTALAAFGIHAVESATAAGNAAFEMSEKFGLTGSQASAYLAVGQQLGLTNEQVSKSFQFLSKNVSGMELTLQAGGKITATQGQVYKDLGINVFDATGHLKSANELMLEAADAFQRLPEGPERAALAMKLFGKSGTDMLPMLVQGRAGILAMMEAGRQSGTVMSDEQVAAAHKLTIEQAKLNMVQQGITTQIGLFLMPALMAIETFIFNNVVPAVKSMADWWSKHLYPALQQVYAGFMQLVGPALVYIKANISQLEPILKLVGIGLLIGLGIVVVVIGVVVAAVVGLVALIVWAVTNVRRSWPGFSSAIVSGVQSALSWLNSIGTWLQNAPGNFASWARGLGLSIWQGIVNGINAAGSAVMNAIKNLLPGGAGGPVAIALHAAGVPGFQFGGVVQGPYLGAPVLIQAHAGERYFGAPGMPIPPGLGELGGSMDTRGIERRLDDLIAIVGTQPGGQTGTEAALWRAFQNAGMNRLRGAAGR